MNDGDGVGMVEFLTEAGDGAVFSLSDSTWTESADEMKSLTLELYLLNGAHISIWKPQMELLFICWKYHQGEADQVASCEALTEGVSI